MNRREHFPHLDKYKSYDIKTIKDDSIFDELAKKDIDLVCGGPPCQGFSRIGIRRSYSVEKKHLPSNHLLKTWQNIRRVKPKVFIFENVEGLLKSKWTAMALEEKYSTIFMDLQEQTEGYDVRFKLLHARLRCSSKTSSSHCGSVRDGLITAKSDSDDAVEAAT